MDGVDPGLGFEVEGVGSSEEADESTFMGEPLGEGEGEGVGIRVYVVVAHGDGASADGSAGEESGVEGAVWVAD